MAARKKSPVHVIADVLALAIFNERFILKKTFLIEHLV